MSLANVLQDFSKIEYLVIDETDDFFRLENQHLFMGIWNKLDSQVNMLP